MTDALYGIGAALGLGALLLAGRDGSLTSVSEQRRRTLLVPAALAADYTKAPLDAMYVTGSSALNAAFAYCRDHHIAFRPLSGPDYGDPLAHPADISDKPIPLTTGLPTQGHGDTYYGPGRRWCIGGPAWTAVVDSGRFAAEIEAAKSPTARDTVQATRPAIFEELSPETSSNVVLASTGETIGLKSGETIGMKQSGKSSVPFADVYGVPLSEDLRLYLPVRELGICCWPALEWRSPAHGLFWLRHYEQFRYGSWSRPWAAAALQGEGFFPPFSPLVQKMSLTYTSKGDFATDECLHMADPPPMSGYYRGLLEPRCAFEQRALGELYYLLCVQLAAHGFLPPPTVGANVPMKGLYPYAKKGQTGGGLFGGIAKFFEDHGTQILAGVAGGAKGLFGVMGREVYLAISGALEGIVSSGAPWDPSWAPVPTPMSVLGMSYPILQVAAKPAGELAQQQHATSLGLALLAQKAKAL